MKKVYLVMSLLIMSAGSVFGQSIADQLKVAECSFRFFDGPTELKVIDQMVTMRSVEKLNGEIKTYGRAYHIEFSYIGDPVSLSGSTVEFLDKNKRPIHSLFLEDEGRFMKVDTEGQRMNPKTRYVALSLEGIPLRVLDGVISIRIKKD